MPAFRATLDLHGKTATGISVPEVVVEQLGGGRKPAVSVRLGSYSYRTTVARRGGGYLIPVSGERRTAAGLQAGDAVEVVLELDTARREVTVPPVLADALDPAARARFDALSYSRQLGHVLAIEGAKTPETLARRITKVLADLG